MTLVYCCCFCAYQVRNVHAMVMAIRWVLIVFTEFKEESLASASLTTASAFIDDDDDDVDDDRPPPRSTFFKILQLTNKGLELEGFTV